MKETFSDLNPKAKIFEELVVHQPLWWKLLCEDNDLYIEIRKDNYISVYYFGGSVAKIDYNKHGFFAETHQKYLGDDKPRGKTKKGTNKFEYDKLDLLNLDKRLIAEIKNRIKRDYVRHIGSEKPAEKWIQGKMIKENPNYIDSEFQFNKDSEIGELRIDLIELSGGVLSFVELKGIFDSRLRNDEKRNAKVPEIIEQMEKYQLFINKYETEITNHYEKLFEIKHNLGLIGLENPQFVFNKKPKLVIANTYDHITTERKKRIIAIEELLNANNIDYVIE